MMDNLSKYCKNCPVAMLELISFNLSLPLSLLICLNCQWTNCSNNVNSRLANKCLDLYSFEYCPMLISLFSQLFVFIGRQRQERMAIVMMVNYILVLRANKWIKTIVEGEARKRRTGKGNRTKKTRERIMIIEMEFVERGENKIEIKTKSQRNTIQTTNGDIAKRDNK